MHTVLADTEAILHRIWAHAGTLPTLVRINAFVLDLETVRAPYIIWVHLVVPGRRPDGSLRGGARE